MEKEFQYEPDSRKKLEFGSATLQKCILIISSFIIVATIIMIMLLKTKRRADTASKIGKSSSHQIDYPPGVRSATLNLQGGRYIELKSNISKVYQIGQGVTVKEKNGHLIYVVKGKQTSGMLQELVVPFGSEYILDMADHTNVWLNSGSKLKYFSIYNFAVKFVWLEGQAHFRIKNPARQQIQVMANGLSIQADCSEFAVDAYLSQYTRVYAYDGKVNIGRENYVTTMSIHQDTILQGINGLFSFVDVQFTEDIPTSVDGYFSFIRYSLRQMTDELTRWYNVHFEFSDDFNVSNRIHSFIPREYSLQEILQYLARDGLASFEVQKGRKVVVKPLKRRW
ncbi:FecR family protein [Pseudoflavitalea sp. X16]|uniref:FecR family protein n=1 Tax=Paraflavitalea devenefica TaxID=2716334 RepID=UPI00141EFA90|nr:FecR family protein [Paraflavitalea devenefica]NII26223.1 FecR family protein [Paraflavitalea devenefica]